MNVELELKLKNKYPVILKDYGGDMRYTCMAWGMSHGDGWYAILENLLQELQTISDKTGVKIIADQIKEKFGVLNFYYHLEYKPTYIDSLANKFRNFMYNHKLGVQYNSIIHFKRKYIWKSTEEKIQDFVNDAEELSQYVCEVCGKAGTLNSDGWLTTLCDKCRKVKQ